MTQFPDGATEVWEALLLRILKQGSQVAARHNDTLELLNVSSCIDMRRPVVATIERKLGYRFMAAEAAWILSGSNQLSVIRPYAEAMAAFSDNGYVLQGAYGPKITEQARYVVDKLASDVNSRQAVINIWRESPRDTLDTPCTLSLQFLIRGKSLHVIATMRSSDLWLGWPYDVFSFTMTAMWVLLALGTRYNLVPGVLYLNAGSQHLYARDLTKAQGCLESRRHQFGPLNHLDYETPDHLYRHLCHLKDGRFSHLKSTFMEELSAHSKVKSD